MIPKGWIRLTLHTGSFWYVKAELIMSLLSYWHEPLECKYTLVQVPGEKVDVQENIIEIFDLITDAAKGREQSI